jgi:hypothetical protein
MDGIVERIGVFGLVGLFSGFVSGLFGIGGGIAPNSLVCLSVAAVRGGASGPDARGARNVHGAGAPERGGVDP